MTKKVKFFSEPISDQITEESLAGLEGFGITHDWGDSLITFYVQVDENRKIVRVGDDLYYLDGENGYCIHYCPVDNGNYARGIITELFECLEWVLLCEASNG